MLVHPAGLPSSAAKADSKRRSSERAIPLAKCYRGGELVVGFVSHVGPQARPNLPIQRPSTFSDDRRETN
jgi:hypothetical protein